MNYHFIYMYIDISYIHRYTYIGYSYVPWNPEIWHVEWLCTEITKFRFDSFNWNFSKLMFSSLLWEISLHGETSSVILNKHFKYQVRLLNLWMSKERAPTDTVRTGSGFVPNGLFWTPIYGRIQVLWSCNSKFNNLISSFHPKHSTFWGRLIPKQQKKKKNGCRDFNGIWHTNSQNTTLSGDEIFNRYNVVSGARGP